MNSLPLSIKNDVVQEITKIFDQESNIMLGGLHCQTNRLAEDVLRRYTETPCVLTSSGTSALIISFEYALEKAGNRPVELYISEYLYFSIASMVEMSGFKVNIIESEHDEVTLKLPEINQQTFNIFILTSHNNKNVNVSQTISRSPIDSTFVIEDRCVVMGNIITDEVDVACYSFSNNKMIIAGEGGCVSSKHLDFLEWARMRTFSGIIPFNDNPNFMYLGNYYNGKIKTPFKCSANVFVGAMINSQIKMLDEHLDQRRKIYQMMYDKLHYNDNQAVLPHAPLFYPLYLPESLSGRQIKSLQLSALKNGVSTYIGVLPYRYYQTGNHDKRILSIPVHTNLSTNDIDKIIDVIHTKVSEFL